MPDDNSLDIFGAKPLSKAVEKVTERSVDGISNFFGAICMPAAEEFGLLLRDKVSAYRKMNLESIAAKTKKKIDEQKLSPSGDANPQLLHQVIEEASWSSDETVQSMWAGLLAVASSNTATADDSLLYTETLRRLTPFQARLINKIYGDPRCCAIENAGSHKTEAAFYPKNLLRYSVVSVLKQFPGDLSSIVPIANSTHESILKNEDCYGIALSRFRPQIEALVTLGLAHEILFLSGRAEGIQVVPSLKGLDFYMRCIGYSIYPLEAFLITLQHWCKQRGVDPFTHTET